MHFVFRHPWVVRVTARPVIRDSEPRAAWCNTADRIILIYDQADQRAKLLRHECWHAYSHDFGVPDQADVEEMAAHVAQFGGMFEGQFAEQGGAPALSQMMPADKEVGAGPALSTAARSLDWRCCGNCRAAVAPGSIDTANARWSQSYGCWIVDRKMCCEVCDVYTHWSERATPEGVPTGQIVEIPKPRITRAGKELAAA